MGALRGTNPNPPVVMQPITVKQVLQDALALVRQGWVRGRMEKRRGDRVCYCAGGAIDAATPNIGLRFEARLTLAEAIPRERRGRPSVVGYNDAPGRTKSDVIALFERAIAACKTPRLV